MTFKKASVFAVLIAATGCVATFTPPARAQFDAPDQYANPLPESGRWFANDGSRTGFFIDVQDDILAGLYVGGDAEGNNAWLSFSGKLQPVLVTDDPEGGWILETDLLRFAGSGCIIACAGSIARESTYEDVGDIRIDFLGRSLARVQVDDRPVMEITPLYFGVPRTELNPQAPPIFLPELAGKWVVGKVPFNTFPDSYDRAAVIEIGERTVEELELPEDPAPDAPNVRYRYPIIDDPDEMFPTGSRIECTTFVDTSRRPSCLLLFDLGPMAQFDVRFDSITDSRLTIVQSFDVVGLTNTLQYQLLKLNHD